MTRESSAGRAEGKERQKAGGLFEGLSMAQVVAGALAAVTSMLLSSQIGITGSVIGVAVGSVVSTVSSQLYKKFVQKGVDKVKDIASLDEAGPNGTVVMSRPTVPDVLDDDGQPAREDASALELTDPRLRFSESRDAQVMREAADAERAETGTTIVMPRLEDKRKRRRVARMKRNVIIVSVAASVIAVAASAFVVNAVTAGNGIGYKTQPIIAVQHEQGHDDTSYAGAAAQEDDVSGEASGSTNTSADAGASSGSSSVDGGEAGNQAGSAADKPGSSAGDETTDGSGGGSSDDAGQDGSQGAQTSPAGTGAADGQDVGASPS